jgi:hypothetical protein
LTTVSGLLWNVPCQIQKKYVHRSGASQGVSTPWNDKRHESHHGSLILRRIQRDAVVSVNRSSFKVPVILARF